jgi:hypothetical protein
MMNRNVDTGRIHFLIGNYMKRLLILAATVVGAATLAPQAALASSHREAPFITKNPKVDGTDFYLFNSYENGRTDFVTVIANYQPLQDAYGGPNYFSMDPEALYEIHFDNTGDGVEDITFQFRFQTSLGNGSGVGIQALPDGGLTIGVASGLADGGLVPIPLINAGAVAITDGGLGAAQGQAESFTVNIVRGARRTGTVAAVTNANGGATSFAKPLDNIGAKTFGTSYADYARSFIYSVNIPGCATPAKLFVGQRAEGFAVNLGTIFDLVNAPAAVITDPMTRGAVPNPIATKNITSLAMEIPKACLTTATSTVVGGWTTASVRQARVVNPNGSFARPTVEGGAWTQVSRLGMPLVNEVVIGVPDKDKFNTSEPRNDLANFGRYVVNPTLPLLLQVLFSVQAPTVDRSDLVAVFGTGVQGVNQIGMTPAVAEMLRLNTALPATAAGMQNPLGAAACFPNRSLTPTVTAPGCDVGGFPNGRRPIDDVVDIALRVVMGYLLPPAQAPAGAVPFHDAVAQEATMFDTIFPYLRAPTPGS